MSENASEHLHNRNLKKKSWLYFHMDITDIEYTLEN